MNKIVELYMTDFDDAPHLTASGVAQWCVKGPGVHLPMGEWTVDGTDPRIMARNVAAALNAAFYLGQAVNLSSREGVNE